MSIKLIGNSLNIKNSHENSSFEFFPITSIQKSIPKTDKLSRAQPIKIISTDDTKK